MHNDPALSAIERAMVLAREGRHQNVSDLRKQVRNEGYGSTDAYLSSPSITAQLRRLLREARQEGR